MIIRQALMTRRKYQRTCLKRQPYQIIKLETLMLDYDGQDDMFVVISLKLLYKEELAIQYEFTNVFNLACCSDQSSIKPFVFKKVISSLLCRDLYHFYPVNVY